MIRRPPKSPLFPYPTLFRPRVTAEVPDLRGRGGVAQRRGRGVLVRRERGRLLVPPLGLARQATGEAELRRSEEHTSELQSQSNLVCRLLLEKKKKITYVITT